MIRFFVLSLNLFAFQATAMPAVGDQVTLHGTYTSVETKKSAKFIQEIELKKIDTATDEAVVHYDLYLPNGELKSQDETSKASQLIKDSTVQDMLDKCESYGGKSETVEVLAGEFPTCSLPKDGGGQVWVGKVPFGIVKDKSIDEKGNIIELEAVFYTVGAPASL